MSYERLQLPEAATDQFSDSVINTLRMMEGIQEASRAPGSLEVTVRFDRAVTSVVAMRAGLSQAGHSIEPKPVASGTGGCCGACGG